jgi:hypothetical protein
MAMANVARRHGDDFQARLFWLKASSLLDSKSPIIKVIYENGPKSFDDVCVEYDPAGAPMDHHGSPVLRRHTQCKWHSTAGVFGHDDLPLPSFINAKTHSLLQRSHAAQLAHAPDGTGSQFELFTNWRLKPGDPLIELVRKQTDALDLARLFDGTTDASRMGKVRKLWRQHLRIDDDALRLVARTMTIAERPESLESLRERLDDRFAVVGLRRIPPSETAFIYDDLVAKLLAQGRIEFDRSSFRILCERERLMDPSATPKQMLTLGVRSFVHPIDNLDERCPRIVDFLPYFEGRYIRNEADWQDRILPALIDFVCTAAREADALRVMLDAHASLAFAVGSVLNVKAGKAIEIEQRMGGRRFWSAQDVLVDPAWPKFSFEQEIHDHQGPDIALAVGLTHDVAQGARAFISAYRPEVGRTLHCRPEGGNSQMSVRCGRHAWMLAESAVQEVRRIRDAGYVRGRVHIFIAGPNGFTFFLGQQQEALGAVSLYEWDFEGRRGGTYLPSLAIA